jgi:signal transduction histidine kinase
MDSRSSRKALQVIDRNAHLQAQLVADILDVSRIITGGLRLHLQPVDLGSVIGATLDAVRPAADAKQVQLRSRLDTVARLTEGDPQRLQQIVWNLLSNAVKFTRHQEKAVIEIGCTGANGKQVEYFVRDNGAGFDMSYAGRLFAPFQRLHLSTEFPGTGIGLATVLRIVQRHGGRIWAEGSVGQGATFHFTLARPRT